MDALALTILSGDLLVPVGVVVTLLGLVAAGAWKLAQGAWMVARGVQRLEAAAGQSFTKQHMAGFAAELKAQNPKLNVPNVNTVIRDVDAATAPPRAGVL